MQKNNCLLKKDYESYGVILPFTAIFKKNRKQFLCSELEKLHPCFSDEFAYDSRIKKISRNGMMADVLVINKYKLAEYEGRRRMSGSGFYLENNKLWHRFFVNKKWKRIIFLFLTSLVFFAAFIVNSLFKAFSDNKKSYALIEEMQSLKKTEELEEIEYKENAEKVLFNDAEIESNTNLEEKFFAAILEANGKIDSFEWKIEGYTKVLNASLKGIYPENLMEVKKGLSLQSAFSADDEQVIYEQSVPKMKVSYKTEVNRQNQHGRSDRQFFSAKATATAYASATTTTPAKNSDFNKTIRNVIRQYGGVLKQENAPPYHIEFDYTFSSDENGKLFDILSEVVQKNGRTVTCFSLQSLNNGELEYENFRIGISIEQFNSESLKTADAFVLSEVMKGFDMTYISKYMKLFISSSKQIRKPVKQTEMALLNDYQEQYTKLGEIKKSNVISDNTVSGKNDITTLTFYKNENGKIFSVVTKN